MLYLIKSNKRDTYWAPNQNGYESVIANAGFYEEEEAKKIVSLSSGNAEMIPITVDILEKAYIQLRKIRKEILEERKSEDYRHKRMIEDFDRKDNVIDNGFSQLNNVAKQLGI